VIRRFYHPEWLESAIGGRDALRDIIPDPVFEAIQERLRTVADRAHNAWPAANAEEDTLTGDLCGQLRTDPRRIRINGSQEWEWRIGYKKFRGRAKSAFESINGADGIIDIEVTREEEKFYKGILFQAKKGDLRVDAEITKQVSKMEKLAHGSSAVFEYRKDGYFAIPGNIFLERSSDRQARRILVQRNERPLGSFLGDGFLPCTFGLRGLYYDAVRELLLVPNGANGVRALPVELHYRLRIDVERLR
jgi:hypothetical protein